MIFCIVDEQGPFVEREFTLRVYDQPNLAIDLFGTIDFAWKHTTTGEIIVGDHKTSSALSFGGSSYFDRDKPNHQYTAYMLGAQEVFGFETENFCVNVVEVKARPKTARGQPPSFPRQITRRTKEDFEEFLQILVYYVQRYLECKKENFWPLGPVGSCNAYGDHEVEFIKDRLYEHPRLHEVIQSMSSFLSELPPRRLKFSKRD